MLMDYYGDGRNELHGGLDFVFIDAPSRRTRSRSVVEEPKRPPPGGWPIWTASNHDVSRAVDPLGRQDFWQPGKDQGGPADARHAPRDAMPLPG